MDRKSEDLAIQDGNHTSSTTSSTSGCISGDESSDKTSSYPFAGSSENEFIQASLNFISVLELTEAVEQCKEMVLDTKEFSEERKWLVRHLIELRLRLEEAREAEKEHRQLLPIGIPDQLPTDSPTAVKEHDHACTRDRRILLGHHLVLQAPSSITTTCDQCCGNIWSLLHPWYLCSDCSYRCHIKCIDKTKRLCAHVRACETPYFSNVITPEVGLAAQGYRCYECETHITFKHSWVEPRQCDYDGRYYCANCHWNRTAVIPARVVHNWDFGERPVCCSCNQYLRLMLRRPVINIDLLNPQLSSCVDELGRAKNLRIQLLHMKQYLIICTSALKEKPKKKLIWSLPLHLVESPPGIFSLQDLLNLREGSLISMLQDSAETSLYHIKKECKVCFAKGFCCELCKDKPGEKRKEVLFPFDDAVSLCSKCSAVFHRDCWVSRMEKCPRCERIQDRQSKQESLE